MNEKKCGAMDYIVLTINSQFEVLTPPLCIGNEDKAFKEVIHVK